MRNADKDYDEGYEQGILAVHAGLNKLQNPYDEGSQEWEGWNDGYDSEFPEEDDA